MKRNIAIIDDDVLVRQSLEDCMESAGYLTEGFGSAEEFLQSGGPRDAACLIVDVQLPGITGLQLQERLAGAGSCVPIVFVSALGVAKNRETAIRRGAAGFLAKPFRRDELLNLIGAAIGR
ncbi:MAG TPA: response regulator [Verrucomicrobiae bacterium]|nr:response regulator [Verrucomicrobiae bacterium]